MAHPPDWTPEGEDPLKELGKKLGDMLDQAKLQIPAAGAQRITVQIGEAVYPGSGSSWSQPLEGVSQEEAWQLLEQVRRLVLERLRELAARRRTAAPASGGPAGGSDR